VPERSPLQQQIRLQAIWFVAISLIVLIAAGLAVYAAAESSSGQGACFYQKSIYPASHRFRLDVKGFMHQTYLTWSSEAQFLRNAAAQQPTAQGRDTLNALALHDARAAARAKRAWLDIQLPGPPTCS